MALRLVQLMYGDEVAQAVQLGIEYDPEPPLTPVRPRRPRADRDLVRTTLGPRRAWLSRLLSLR